MISTRIFLEMSKTNPKTKGRMVIGPVKIYAQIYLQAPAE